MAHDYRFIEHTADLAVEATADDRAGLLRASLEALAEAMELPEPGDGAGKMRRDISLEPAQDDAMTLVDALNEWLFHVRDKGLRPARTSVRWDGDGVRITLQGSRDSSGRPLAAEIKAVTLHRAEVTPAGEHGDRLRAFWIADV